jgi:pimeloyl-ACP methyl ester carboxylesterase
MLRHRGSRIGTVSDRGLTTFLVAAIVPLSLSVLVAPVLTSTSSAAIAPPKLSWHPCADPAQKGFQCATARGVPLDYRHPSGRAIHLALIRHRAGDPAHRIGTLFFNPGGPGGMGTVGLPKELGNFPARLRARFDLMSWDPRGVGSSTAVQCFDSSEDENNYFAGTPNGFPVGTAQMNTWIERYGAFGRRCTRVVGGRLLRHVSTADSARDLNLLRRAVGDRRLNYLGISYGTYLGATYANLFPERIRAVTIDGNINPIAYSRRRLKANGGKFLGTSLRRGDDRAAARTLNAFLDLCGRAGTSRCAFSAGSPAATRAKFTALLKRFRTHTSGAAPMTYAELVTGTVFALYTTEPSPYGRPGWSAWAQELQDLWTGNARQGTPDAFDPLPVAGASGRRYVGPEQAVSILCSESPNPRADAFKRQDRLAYRRSGAVGPYWAWVPEPCAGWPAIAADGYAGPWNRRTANPLLVIGNTHDPSTAYRESVAMAHELARARLLTVEGYGHTVLENPSACANRYESRYFIDGAMPPAGTTCRQDRPPFTGMP